MLKVLLRFSPHKPDEAMLFMNLNMKDAEHLMAILDKRWIDI
jgi:hypothetical protein